MDFTKSILDIIRERKSHRTYSGESLEKSTRDRVIQILENLQCKSPFSEYTKNVRFELLNVPEFDPDERKKLGTYGLIKGAQDFIVGAVEISKF